jgi:hypothetical protein
MSFMHMREISGYECNRPSRVDMSSFIGIHSQAAPLHLPPAAAPSSETRMTTTTTTFTYSTPSAPEEEVSHLVKRNEPPMACMSRCPLPRELPDPLSHKFPHFFTASALSPQAKPLLQPLQPLQTPTHPSIIFAITPIFP